MADKVGQIKVDIYANEVPKVEILGKIPPRIMQSLPRLIQVRYRQVLALERRGIKIEVRQPAAVPTEEKKKAKVTTAGTRTKLFSAKLADKKDEAKLTKKQEIKNGTHKGTETVRGDDEK